jgi:hypothetical protein
LAGHQYSQRSTEHDLPDSDPELPYLSDRDEQEHRGKYDNSNLRTFTVLVSGISICHQ